MPVPRPVTQPDSQIALLIYRRRHYGVDFAGCPYQLTGCMQSTKVQHKPANQPTILLLPSTSGHASEWSKSEDLFRPTCSIISSCHGSGAGPLLPGAHRKYILYGCESWETLPPASRLTTAYQSLNRGDSTLGGLGRAAASHRLAGGNGNGIGWAVDGATFLNPSGQPRTPLHGLCF